MACLGPRTPTFVRHAGSSKPYMPSAAHACSVHNVQHFATSALFICSLTREFQLYLPPAANVGDFEKMKIYLLLLYQYYISVLLYKIIRKMEGRAIVRTYKAILTQSFLVYLFTKFVHLLTRFVCRCVSGDRY